MRLRRGCRCQRTVIVMTSLCLCASVVSLCELESVVSFGRGRGSITSELLCSLFPAPSSGWVGDRLTAHSSSVRRRVISVFGNRNGNGNGLGLEFKWEGDLCGLWVALLICSYLRYLRFHCSHGFLANSWRPSRLCGSLAAPCSRRQSRAPGSDYTVSGHSPTLRSACMVKPSPSAWGRILAPPASVGSHGTPSGSTPSRSTASNPAGER